MFGATFLATGAALLTYVLSGLSLPGTVLLIAGCAVPTARFIWRRAPEVARSDLRRSIRAGLLAGLLATGAYDLARYLLVATGFRFRPFDVFALFGQALLGSHVPAPLMTLAGAGYHLANGVGFGLAYTVWFGRRGALAGVGWAMALETMMVSVYPGWLGLKALEEFLSVSVFGHLAYGGVLGFSARALLLRKGAEGGRG
jgi:hypothetical protein